MKKHHQELGVPETSEPASKTDDDDDSDLASLARELGQDDDDEKFSPLDSPFIKKVSTPINTFLSSTLFHHFLPLKRKRMLPLTTLNTG